jgi:hypothetical protein
LRSRKDEVVMSSVLCATEFSINDNFKRLEPLERQMVGNEDVGVEPTLKIKVELEIFKIMESITIEPIPKRTSLCEMLDLKISIDSIPREALEISAE